MALPIRHILLLSAALASLFTAPAFAGFSFATLGTFNVTNGKEPGSNLALSNNVLYGTTVFGGANGDGAVYSIPITGGTPTRLASFNGTNGNQPAGLVLSGNTLYGTTIAGTGTVFSIPLTGGTPTVLSTFNSTTGDDLVPNIAISGNTLYGMTSAGGANHDGTIFSLPITGGTPTVLASFSSNLFNPAPGLIISGNTLYGATVAGTNNAGTIFSLPLTGGTPTVLASFSGIGTGPNCPILFGNTFYGTITFGGANNFGAVYSLPLTGGTPTVLASFNMSDGWQPDNGVVISGNTIYGTTLEGGANPGGGVVFSVPLTGGTPTALISLGGNTGGVSPNSSLLLSGNTLYGTTQISGPNTGGTVFSLTSNPAISLSSAPPTSFGQQLGSLTITGANGNYTPATQSFPSTSTGYVAVSNWNPTTDTETYALNIADSTPANLDADLAALADQINAGAYNNFSVTASTTAPTGIVSANGYDFYLTFTNPTLGTSSDYFGFDLSQLNNTTDVLTATAVAIPEPTALSLLVMASLSLLPRRWHSPRTRIFQKGF